MKQTQPTSAKRHLETGYAILMVIFLATLMLIMAMAAAPNILTNGRRQKEEVMIWRGKQYVRGIKLYYRKMGHFPTSLDDLTKPQMGNIRFMRQAYKDPMNTEDGSWRLVYVGPSGQLIGSLKPPQTLQMPGVPAGQMGTPASTLASGQSSTSPGQGQSATGGSQGETPQSGQGTNTGTQSGSQTGTNPSGGNDTSGTASPSSATEDQGNSNSLFPDDSSTSTPTIMGGNIIGVGSKVNHRSVIVYEKAKNYRLFEFVWDPSKDPLLLGGSGTPMGAPAGTLGTTPGISNPGLGNPGAAPLNPAPAPTEPPTTDQNPPSN
ncbi:MAG TPA: hypothetical protein VLX32_00875 [Candidatus Acidoferrum sp.]|nr:hypothetical protein [Candidatus Acidoferrum sp.]